MHTEVGNNFFSTENVLLVIGRSQAENTRDIQCLILAQSKAENTRDIECLALSIIVHITSQQTNRIIYDFYVNNLWKIIHID